MLKAIKIEEISLGNKYYVPTEGRPVSVGIQSKAEPKREDNDSDQKFTINFGWMALQS
jgi:hypothetical protein